MKNDKLFKVLLQPRVSEKSTRLMAERKYVFAVAKDSNKQEIAAAVKTLFNVEVDSVNICNVKGKRKKIGRVEGRRNHWKKAYVTLKEGNVIAEFSGGA